MKKVFTMALLVLTAASLMTACKKDKNDEPTTNTETVVTGTLTFNPVVDEEFHKFYCDIVHFGIFNENGILRKTSLVAVDSASTSYTFTCPCTIRFYTNYILNSSTGLDPNTHYSFHVGPYYVVKTSKSEMTNDEAGKPISGMGQALIDAYIPHLEQDTSVFKVAADGTITRIK